jgi:hypothetical protein
MVEGVDPEVAVPLQFEFVPPPVPVTPLPAVTVPRVNDSFACVVANTATLESPATLPSMAVKPTSWKTTPVVMGPVTVSAVPGAAALLGVATTVDALGVLPTYAQPLVQSSPPYTVRPSSVPVSASCSL